MLRFLQQVRGLSLAFALLGVLPLAAQRPVPAEPTYYGTLNSAAAFTEYSNSSSHIILGEARQRKFAGLTLAYQRRIGATRWMLWDYSAEIRPVLVESDPTLRGYRIASTIGSKSYLNIFRYPQQLPILKTQQYRSGSSSGVLPDGTPFSLQAQFDLGRRWTYTPGLTPACVALHLFPAHRLQPFLESTGGFVASARDIPLFKSSAFNFTFSFGGGMEWFRDTHRSWSIGYRVEHMSNKYLGSQNPGVDSQFIRAGYRFGR